MDSKSSSTESLDKNTSNGIAATATATATAADTLKPPPPQARTSSSSSIKQPYTPESITSLDCKILQYEYGIFKLEKFISHIKKLISESQSSSNLPLLHYIVLLVGNTFSINEKAFDQKLDMLSNYKLFKNTTINISAATSHIPYDTPDLKIVPVNDLPDIPTAIKCLKQLEGLCNTCLLGYQKRLEQAKVEKAKIIKTIDNSDYYITIRKILANEIFHGDIDFILTDSTFPLPIDNAELMENENFQEASLIDMDVKELFAIVKHVDQLLTALKPLIAKLKKPTNNDPYALHKVFLLTQRLNDMYTIVRRYGRNIYLSNYQHLTDSKFLYHCKNPNYFKTTNLKDMNDFFNSMKKNGTLIANLTRLIRQDARFDITSKNVTNNMNFTVQGFMIIETTLAKLKDFGLNWIISELKFRRIYQLPKKNLFDIYQSIPEFKPKGGAAIAPPPAPATPTKAGSPSPQPQAADKTPATNGEALDKSLTKDSASKPRSRSSSVSSITSNGSSSGLMRRNSVNSPVKATATSLQNGRGSPRTIGRTNSLLSLQHTSTTTTSESETDKKSSSPASPAPGRRRSNSQPIGKDAILATSGAAAALTRNGSISRGSPVKSPSTGSIPKSKPSPEKAVPVSSGLSKVTQKLLKVEEEESAPVPPSTSSPPPPPTISPEDAAPAARAATKLTAAQRFQQRVREQARSGSLVTQQKEVLTSVTFDPNNTSKLPLRRYSDQPAAAAANASAAAAAGADQLLPEVEEKVAPLPQRRTRDQVTRQNTQRNSRIVYNEATENMSSSTNSSIDQATTVTNSSSSESSTTDGSATITVKKVRFTGVPEWTEAEDAPTKYANAILRNFAVFRHPIRATKAACVKSDQLLKEESMSFRTTSVQDDNDATITNKQKTGLSRIKNRIM
ncbi:hypothetical protein Cantr_07955 [Candida viswanathii]|uniref:GLC7-interacting protein 4 n=1 Tax=Candida viswanathii TaxID=5486 RepID=A0A367Y0Y9_9ASCO|nr:hypothetical protein Cantr_07955 [Candida viswanathii]